MEVFDQLGIDPVKFAIQLLLMAIFSGIPAFYAMARVIKFRSGAAVPLWFLLIWSVPIIGSVVTLLVVRGPEPEE